MSGLRLGGAVADTKLASFPSESAIQGGKIVKPVLANGNTNDGLPKNVRALNDHTEQEDNRHLTHLGYDHNPARQTIPSNTSFLRPGHTILGTVKASQDPSIDQGDISRRPISYKNSANPKTRIQAPT